MREPASHPFHTLHSALCTLHSCSSLPLVQNFPDVRVVFLTHNYPRAAGDIAGGFLHPLAVALSRRGVDVQVIAPSDAGKGGRDVLDGIPVARVRNEHPDP